MPNGPAIGPYRILRLIRRGGQGSVFLGYDDRLRRKVAIKVVSLPHSASARRAIFREARAVAALNSPKVVAIYDVVESADHLALVTEYVPGCDLEEFLQAGRPSLASIVTIAADVASALAAARRRELVHGDVKAANILITESGRAKLTDFGICLRTGTGATTGGSPSGLSPEQCLGEPVDSRTDLFALGCLLYRMLAGQPPFFREGRLDTDWLVARSPRPLSGLVAPEEEVPDQLISMVMQLVARKPGDRPATYRPVRGVLRNIKREMPRTVENDLLAEAKPFFRPESQEDIPPPVPPDLGRGSLSRLTRLSFWPYWYMSGWRKAALIVALFLVFALPAGLIALHSQRAAVLIEVPSIDTGQSGDQPDWMSAYWLAEQAEAGLQERFSIAEIENAAVDKGKTVYFAAGDNPVPDYDERLKLMVHCRQGLCVLALSRRYGDRRETRHAVLLPGMSKEHAADSVRIAAAQLYD